MKLCFIFVFLASSIVNAAPIPKLQPIDPDGVAFLGIYVQIKKNNSGVCIGGAWKNFPAHRVGMLPGDFIVGVGQTDINDLNQLRNVLKLYRTGSTTEIKVIRHTVKGISKLTFKITFDCQEKTDTQKKLGI